MSSRGHSGLVDVRRWRRCSYSSILLGY
jgi:hypothetical protein